MAQRMARSGTRLFTGVGAGTTTHDAASDLGVAASIGGGGRGARAPMLGLGVVFLSAPRTQTGHFGAGLGAWM